MKLRLSTLHIRPLKEYGIALGATLIAFFVRFLLDPLLGDHLPFFTFFLAVMVATWYGGAGASLTAAVAGGLLSNWFFMTPRCSLELKGIQQQVGYYVVMITFIWFGQALRRAREQSDITADNIRREIVERKRAETALRESEARLKLFIEHAPAAIAMFDTTMRYLAVSRQFMKDYGITEDPLGQSHYEQFPELPERWKEVHRRALAGEVLQADADPFIRAAGRIQYLKWEARPWQTAGGDIGGILIAIEEVTSRVQAAEALRLSEERLRSILDQAPVAIFIKDPQGRYLFINENAVEALNLDRDKAQGKTDHELLAADLAQQFAEGRRFMSS